MSFECHYHTGMLRHANIEYDRCDITITRLRFGRYRAALTIRLLRAIRAEACHAAA